MKMSEFFLCEKFQNFEVKLSIYLNTRVIVMQTPKPDTFYCRVLILFYSYQCLY